MEGGAEGEGKDEGLQVLTDAVLRVATSTAVAKERLSVHPLVLRVDTDPPEGV